MDLAGFVTAGLVGVIFLLSWLWVKLTKFTEVALLESREKVSSLDKVLSEYQERERAKDEKEAAGLNTIGDAERFLRGSHRSADSDKTN